MKEVVFEFLCADRILLNEINEWRELCSIWRNKVWTQESYLETEVRGVEGKRGRRDRFGP